MRVAVANLKGGTGKTTTAVFPAHALARQGSVLLADADPQGSALGWSETAGELPFPVVALPVKNIRRELASVAAPYDHLVVDTPPGHPALVEPGANLIKARQMMSERLSRPAQRGPAAGDERLWHAVPSFPTSARSGSASSRPTAGE